MPPPPLGVRVRRAALTAAGGALFGALLYMRGVPCVFASVFHTPCPGCGSTRAVLALLEGNLGGVLRYNPFGPVMALLIGVLAVQVLVSMLVHGDLRDAAGGRLGALLKRVLVVVAILEVGLWAARFLGALGGPVPV